MASSGSVQIQPNKGGACHRCKGDDEYAVSLTTPDRSVLVHRHTYWRSRMYRVLTQFAKSTAACKEGKIAPPETDVVALAVEAPARRKKQWNELLQIEKEAEEACQAAFGASAEVALGMLVRATSVSSLDIRPALRRAAEDSVPAPAPTQAAKHGTRLCKIMHRMDYELMKMDISTRHKAVLHRLHTLSAGTSRKYLCAESPSNSWSGCRHVVQVCGGITEARYQAVSDHLSACCGISVPWKKASKKRRRTAPSLQDDLDLTERDLGIVPALSVVPKDMPSKAYTFQIDISHDALVAFHQDVYKTYYTNAESVPLSDFVDVSSEFGGMDRAFRDLCCEHVVRIPPSALISDQKQRDSQFQSHSLHVSCPLDTNRFESYAIEDHIVSHLKLKVSENDAIKDHLSAQLPKSWVEEITRMVFQTPLGGAVAASSSSSSSSSITM